nr:MAG TPA: hypothetical protein [Caudoviricetes sp.]
MLNTISQHTISNIFLHKQSNFKILSFLIFSSISYFLISI